MTPHAKEMIRALGRMATDARRDLGMSANRGTRARPTVAQLNRTLDALRAIETEAAAVLALELPDVTS
jgi:hypothetical protein